MENKNIKIILPALVVLVIGFVFYLLFPESGIGVENKNNSSDLGAAVQVLPRGFPEDIPVRMDGIQESLSSFYEDTETRISFVSYVTDSNRESLYKEYKKYLISKNFNILEETENPIYIYAKNRSSKIVITIEEQDGEVFVTINYSGS